MNTARARLAIFTGLLALVVGVRAQPPEVYQDFRGKKPLIDALKKVGPDADEVCTFEDEGLRVKLPKTRPLQAPVGVGLKFRASGDMEITGTYEILTLEKPPPNSPGVGVAINLVAKNDYKKFAKLGRFHFFASGESHAAESWLPDTQRQFKEVKTTTNKGQVRLIREGNQLRYLVADTPGGEFREIHKGEFTDDDLEIVRFGANNNKTLAAVDVRLIDFRVRYLAKPNAPANPAAPPHAPIVAQHEGPPATRPWLFVALGIGFALTLIFLLLIGVIVFLKQRKPRE